MHLFPTEDASVTFQDLLQWLCPSEVNCGFDARAVLAWLNQSPEMLLLGIMSAHVVLPTRRSDAVAFDRESGLACRDYQPFFAAFQLNKANCKAAALADDYVKRMLTSSHVMNAIVDYASQHGVSGVGLDPDGAASVSAVANTQGSRVFMRWFIECADARQCIHLCERLSDANNHFRCVRRPLGQSRHHRARQLQVILFTFSELACCYTRCGTLQADRVRQRVRCASVDEDRRRRHGPSAVWGRVLTLRAHLQAG